MRVVVTGGTGNVGTSLLPKLVAERTVESVVGLARRSPGVALDKVTWAAGDVATHDLASSFRGADAVVHLAWVIQPSHDLAAMRRTNVEGSRRVFRAVADAGVPTLVYASSVGAYSPAPKDRRVDETWPTDGVRTAFYSRHKASVERWLDSFEREHPAVRVVRMRPALIFKREAGAHARRIFAGPFVPTFLFDRSFIPIVPNIEGLAFQAVHAEDVAEAYLLALLSDARGPFNLAAEPVLSPEELGRVLEAKPLRVPARVVRGLVDATWRLHLQPTPPGWFDMGIRSPIMDVTRATRVLGWRPTFTSRAALLDLLSGLRDSAGLDTPPLAPNAGGPFRVGELGGAVGES